MPQTTVAITKFVGSISLGLLTVSPFLPPLYQPNPFPSVPCSRNFSIAELAPGIRIR